MGANVYGVAQPAPKPCGGGITEQNRLQAGVTS